MVNFQTPLNASERRADAGNQSVSRALNLDQPTGLFGSSIRPENYPYVLPLNGTDQRMDASDTATTTETLLKREHFWLYRKGQDQVDGQRTFNKWRPPTTGPIVL